MVKETSFEQLEEQDLDIRRGSLPLNYLVDDEKDFFNFVEEGNLKNVQDFLNAHRNLNINCVNYQGLTALHFAVKNENGEMLGFLLGRPDIQLKDVVLYAIVTGNIEITETILKALNERSPESEYQTYDDSTEYSSDITPLILAAQCGNFPMIQMLMLRNHHIDRPHKPSCLCPKCKAIMSEAANSLSFIRLNCYKAISNPSYICQATTDPVLYGFLLDYELKLCADVDKEYRSDYLELAEELRSFVVKLVSETRNATEMEIILKQQSGYKGVQDIAFPRLQLAVDFHQKEFVANSLVQQVLSAFWLGNCLSWNRLSLVEKSCRILLRIVLLPVIVLIVIFAPRSKLANKYKAPVNKYVSSLAAYLVFVFFVYLLSAEDEKRSTRGPPRTGLESIIIIFVLGFMLSTFKKFWTQGTKRFFSVAWNWYDMIMECLFVITFFLWSKSAASAKYYKHKNPEQTLRKYWKSSDSTLLHEGFFAISCIMSFGRLAFYCLQSSRLGPMQVSLGKMATQIGYFLIFLLVLITSFALPMTKLYIYYARMTQIAGNGDKTSMLDSFSSFTNSFGTLFWAMFCMSPTESVNVVIENVGGDKKNPKFNYHVFTENVGRLLFSIYQFLVVVALFNTLIAILSNTFQRVVDNADVEWKFARTKLWLHFFHEASTLPSPFNLIPRPSLFTGCTSYCMALANKTPGAKAKFSLKRLFYIDYEKASTDDELLYETLMTQLVQRYLRNDEPNKE